MSACSASSVSSSGTAWGQRLTDERKQGLLFGPKVGGQPGLKKTNGVLGLGLGAVVRLPTGRQAVDQAEGQQQGDVMLARQRHQAGMTFGHGRISPSTNREPARVFRSANQNRDSLRMVGIAVTAESM